MHRRTFAELRSSVNAQTWDALIAGLNIGVNDDGIAIFNCYAPAIRLQGRRTGSDQRNISVAECQPRMFDVYLKAFA